MKNLFSRIAGVAIHRHGSVLFAIVLGAGLLSGTALAQSSNTLTLARSVVAGGGGTSQGGGFELSGTIGQPAAGPVQGGDYSLAGGFWGGVVLIQTAGAPRLSLGLSGTNIVITWPSDSVGFTLEVTANLATPNWLPASPPPQDDGSKKTVTVAPSAVMSYYRLKKP